MSAGKAALLASLAGAGLALAACAPKDPLDGIVRADTSVGLAMWESDARGRLDPATMAAIEESLQQLRFRAMADEAASGRDAIEEVVLSEVDGRSVRYVVELGLGWELKNLRAERGVLDGAMATNARLRTREGDTDSARYLREVRDNQSASLRQMDDRVEALRRKLVALDPVLANDEGPPSPSPSPSPDPPVERAATDQAPKLLDSATPDAPQPPQH
jgi:hypothetical protein